MRFKWTILLCTFLFDAVAAEAGSFAVRIGRFAPQGESDLWFDNVETFDVAVSDFNYPFAGVEFAFELSEFVDFAVGVDGYRRSVVTNYRDFVRDDGTEVIQELRLTVVPITSGVKFYPVGKFHILLPYVTGGFGLYPYEYLEEGEFIDFATFEIFYAVFRDRGTGFGTYAAAGVEAAVSRSFLLFGEYRRHWVWANHGGDFRSFGDFDLDASQLTFGFAVRF
jgi:hypothetical protein